MARPVGDVVVVSRHCPSRSSSSRRLPRRPNLIPPMPGLTTASTGSNWTDPASFAGECVRLAQDEKRFGDVLVAFLPRRQEVRVAATKSLGKRYEQCVLNALGRKACLLHPPARADAFEWTRLYDLQNRQGGAQSPRGSSAERGLGGRQECLVLDAPGGPSGSTKLLPEDMTVEANGCLKRQPATAALGARADCPWFQEREERYRRFGASPLDAIVGDGIRHDGMGSDRADSPGEPRHPRLVLFRAAGRSSTDPGSQEFPPPGDHPLSAADRRCCRGWDSRIA